jgi:hypothetical protein
MRKLFNILALITSTILFSSISTSSFLSAANRPITLNDINGMVKIQLSDGRMLYGSSSTVLTIGQNLNIVNARIEVHLEPSILTNPAEETVFNTTLFDTNTSLGFVNNSNVLLFKIDTLGTFAVIPFNVSPHLRSVKWSEGLFNVTINGDENGFIILIE